MSTAVKLSAEKRDEQGTTACRNLRIQGLVPCNVYGHGQDPVCVKIAADKVRPIIDAGSKVVELEVGGKSEACLIRDVQWDAFGRHVYHVDFQRVDATQRVLVEVPISFRGTAPGVVAGGHLEQHLHSLEIECLALEVPDHIYVKIGHLDLGASLHVSELTDLPPNTTVKTAADTVIVHVAKPQADDDDKAGEAAAPGEPEVVKKKKEDDAKA
jgi:large subunit ribosomal protein L25